MTDLSFDERIKKVLRDLVDKYHQVHRNSVSERDVASDFVEPIFEALGWDTRNLKEYRREENAGAGRVDAVIKINGVNAILIEIKRFGGLNQADVKQITKYLRDHEKGIKYGILTNFEEFYLFNDYTGTSILSINNPDQYFDPRNFGILIGLGKDYFPKALEGKPIESMKGNKNELDCLLESIKNHGFEDNKKNEILYLVLWQYITKTHLPKGIPRDHVWRFLNGNDLTKSENRERIDEIGSQLIGEYIKKNASLINSSINSISQKALKILFGYNHKTDISPYSAKLAYPPRAICPSLVYNKLDNTSIGSIMSYNPQSFDSIRSMARPDIKSEDIINHVSEALLYSLFICKSESWTIGNDFFVSMNKMGLSVLNEVGGRYNSGYVFSRELEDIVKPYFIGVNLDYEKKRVFIAWVLMGIIELTERYDQNWGSLYELIKKSKIEEDIKYIVRDLKKLGITKGEYINELGRPPFYVNDEEKFKEYIDSVILHPILKEIIRK